MEYLKKLNDKLKIRRYYSEEINKGKSYIGSLLDKIIMSLIIFVSLLIYIYIKTNNIVISSIISIQFLIIYAIVFQKISQKKIDESIACIDKKLVKEKIYKNLIDQTPYAYVEYIEKTLKGFSINNTKIYNEKGIDIVGKIREKQIGVKCFQYKEDHKVDVNDVKEFFIELRNKNIKKGMLITTSSFTEDVKLFFKRLEEHVDVKLVDMDELLNKMKKTEIYPSKSEIEKIILQKIRDNRVKVRNESKKIVSRDSTKKCIISGLMLILFGKITPYEGYYNIVGYILISLGLVPIIKSAIEVIVFVDVEENDEKGDTV
ncbi:mrr restriction system domain-containing protein [Gottschalkia acidurici 9a]|uniref:Mrr restriction system domain-containing protein n=1 Tax=Gottschalkia acidurici (strain ATCC 7906 / DSM 604 / BCRC 14475 / CIP 104303 / KCTC 5404 / NCIMB 10678 / 9a) TaxID=1128398 RepID=K0AYD3_GOTA9|nr:restriction endonuclease [Gottschalkia acidurici]AFS78264.1 mrr restriction system domain-containing protein [Gottschalkia acidurici 9a]